MKHGSIFNGALLVAGTSIGGGMLALPIETGLSGFFPSVIIYFLCWALMTCTGLLFLETSIWMKREANLISMAEQTLGLFGKVFAWGLYFFLFYSLTLAYVSGCGNLLSPGISVACSGGVGTGDFRVALRTDDLCGRTDRRTDQCADDGRVGALLFALLWRWAHLT